MSPIYIGQIETLEKNPNQLKKIDVEYKGKIVTLTVRPGVSLLDLLLEHGLEIDYSCKEGICMACMSIVEEGCTSQETQGPLSEEHLKEKKTLLCQARPASRKLKIRQSE